MKQNAICIAAIYFGLIFSVVACAQSSDKMKESQGLPKVEEVFKSRDKNEDGKLAKNELIGFVSNDFEKLDIDKDGFLSIEELAKSSKFQRRMRPNDRRGERPTVDKLIARMDKNKDGKLSKGEVDGPLLDDFSKIDNNKDGFLTKEELEKTPKPEREQQQGSPRN